MKEKNTQTSIMKSVRKTWGDMNPVTRKVESKKKYSRKGRNNNKFSDE